MNKAEAEIEYWGTEVDRLVALMNATQPAQDGYINPDFDRLATEMESAARNYRRLWLTAWAGKAN